MKRKPVLLCLGLLLLAALSIPGCRWGERHTPAEELSALPGISMLEYDGLFLQLKRSASAGNDRILVVKGRAVDQAELRLGEQFTLTDGRHVNETYQVLLISPDRITLKRREAHDQRAAGGGVHTVERVVAVPPYNLENPE